MRLKQAFQINRGDVVSFIGAGGKTSTLVGLGYELIEDGWRVLATTTTRIAEEQLQLVPCALSADTDMLQIASALNQYQFVYLYSDIRDGKVFGPSSEQLGELLDRIDSDVLLVEADGARQLPLKAMREHEPVIPDETSLVVLMGSYTALGQPLVDDSIYNAQAMVEKYGYYKESPMRAPWIGQVMGDPDLSLKDIPQNARTIAFLNRTPASNYGLARGRLIARVALHAGHLNGFALGDTRRLEPIAEVHKPVGAIVLAAGLSTRMGVPKVLLPWENGKTVIEHIVEQLIRSRIDHIAVVTGHHADEVKRLVKPMGARIVKNRAYATGEMLSSVKAGLRSMPEHIAGAFVVLGDQPRIHPRIIYKLRQTYAASGGDIVAPSYRNRRGHPIFISRRYWGEILKLPRSGAPRDVINAHAEDIIYVNFNTDSVLRDIDTPEQYHQERNRAGLRKIDLDEDDLDETKPDSE